MTSNSLEYGGKCAFGVSMGGPAKAPDAKPEYTVVRNGKTYGFSGSVPKMLFQIIPGSSARADKAWAKAQG